MVEEDWASHGEWCVGVEDDEVEGCTKKKRVTRMKMMWKTPRKKVM